MKFNIIVARDILTDSYLVPQFINIEPAAQFQAECRSLYRAPENVLVKYRDLEIFCIGQYDDETSNIDIKKAVLVGSFRSLCEKLLKNLKVEELKDEA